MTASKVRADYEGLQQIAQEFARQSEAIRQTYGAVLQAKDGLQAGDWVGKGADKFYQEMSSSVLPSLNRLAVALGDASQVTLKISQVMKRAEDDSARLFKYDDLDPVVTLTDGSALNASGGTPGNGSGGAGGGTQAGGLAGSSTAGAGQNGSGASGGETPAHNGTTQKTLKVAKDLESELRSAHPDYGKGFNGYGDGKDQYVCTTFVAEVLKRSGYKMPASLQDKVNINLDWESLTGVKKPSQSAKQEALKSLVEAGDPRTKGVVTALVDSNQGTAVANIRQLQPGDFVQYWYTDKKGNTLGHVVQVERVISPGKIVAHGSHAGKNGVDTITVNLNGLKNVYGVRPKPAGSY